MTWPTHVSPAYSIMLLLLIGLAAGLVGSFSLMRRMLLAGDVISHIALPGLGLALLLKVSPLAGAATTLFLGTILIWQLQKKTGLATENIIGVVFAASLGMGAAIIPSEDLAEALFGKFQDLSLIALVMGVAAILTIVVSIWRLKEQLVLTLFSPELAAATGVNVNRLNLYFLLIFSLTVLVGLRFMGALLAGSLIIIPAAAGRRLTDNMSRFLIVSSAVSVVSVGTGLLLSSVVFPGFGLGPTTVVVAAFLFAACLLRRDTKSA
jgi:zinc transport system permease protein